MTSEDYLEQMGYVFLPPYNPRYYPPMMVTYQYQALRTERFRQNKALFRLCTGVIDKIDLKENVVKIMGSYDLAEPLTRLINQLEKGRDFARATG